MIFMEVVIFHPPSNMFTVFTTVAAVANILGETEVLK